MFARQFFEIKSEYYFKLKNDFKYNNSYSLSNNIILLVVNNHSGIPDEGNWLLWG